MSLFKKEGKIRNSVELVSLHIPKTAGTSFRNILKDVYGPESVARLDIHSKIELNSRVLKTKKIKSEIKVLHGHFNYGKFRDSFDIAEGTPVITWLREPAERVVSNYFYLDLILRQELNEEKKDLNILAKMEKTLLEYAATEANRNRISKFLEGISLDEFFFIGFTEYYQEDLARLAKLLNWNSYPLHEHNITGRKPEVDEDSIQRIRELNQDDYKLYEQALKLREERLKSGS